MSGIISKKLYQYYLLTRFHKPIGTLLLLWPTWWALWFAFDGKPDVKVLIVFTAGVVLMRAAGCAINDFADRHIDGAVQRTRDRPLASGAVTPKEAIGVFLVLSLMAFFLVLQLDWRTVQYSFVALLLAIIYPFTKRITYLPQVFLGAAFAWAIPMAYVAALGELTAAAGFLFLATLVWAVIYDTFYAMVDREDDLRIGVKSSAILFGQKDLQVIAGLQLSMLVLLSLVGQLEQARWPYFMSLLLVAMMFARQIWRASDRTRANCFAAFLNNHYVGFIVFAGIAMSTMQ